MSRWLLVALLLTRCGLQNIAEQTQNAVQESNDKQAEILAALERTEKLTQELKGLMETTANGVHLQVLTVSLEQLFRAQNTAMLAPPVRMMPFAQAFANEATPQEAIQIAHLLYLDAFLGPEEETQQRIASLIGMSLIGAFLPKSKIAAIENEQIRNHGRYENAAYHFFTGRYMALRDYLLGDILENSGKLNIGALLEAVEHFHGLTSLVNADYAGALVVEIPSLGVDARVDAKEIKALGVRAHNKFLGDLSPEVASAASQSLSQFLARFSRLMS